jgi:hypothetical protein
MKLIRDNICLKYICIGMAFFIFNFSIDTPDTYGDQVAEDLSFNDIESIAELVLENVLGVYDAIPEHDENDFDDEGGFCKKFDYKFNHDFSYKFISLKPVIEEKTFVQHSSSQPQSAYSNGLIKPPEA